VKGQIEPAELHKLKAEHAGLAQALERMARLAEQLDTAANGTFMAELRAVDALLYDRILPHEQADERELHPALARLLGGRDPMAAISRTHREIGHLIRRFHRLVEELQDASPAVEERVELRRTLYGLEAILRLHFAQEDEIYESVAAEPGR
jgi:iron-sulfur cluster repair protein YtfE (RIC family)